MCLKFRNPLRYTSGSVVTLLCCTVKHFSLYYILISREDPEISSDTKQARLDFMWNMLHNLNASFLQQDI